MSHISVREFNPNQADDRGHHEWYRLQQIIHTESHPDDPMRSPDRVRWELLNPRSTNEHSRWIAHRDGEASGFGIVERELRDQNTHVAFFFIGVEPSSRRAGMAHRVLREITETAREWNRDLLLTWTQSTAPSGEAFMRRLGAHLGQEERCSRLLVADVDPSQMIAWLDAADLQGLEAGYFRGAYPDESLEMVARMKDACNLMPRGELRLEDEHITAAELAESDRRLVARNQDRLTVYLRDSASGEVAGYTQLHFDPEHPDHVGQGDTAVFPNYQRRGLGRWLKARALVWMQEVWPGMKAIRTYNAESNAPMLKINIEMGFRPYYVGQAWQIETDTVRNYLDRVAA